MADAYRMNVLSGPVSDKPRTILYSSGFTGEPKCDCKLTDRRIKRLHKLAVDEAMAMVGA